MTRTESTTTRNPRPNDAVLLYTRPNGDIVTGTIVGRVDGMHQEFVIREDGDGWTCHLYERTELHLLDPDFGENGVVAWEIA